MNISAERMSIDMALNAIVASLERRCLITYVEDLLFADQLNLMPELYGSNYSRIECSTAVGQLEAVRGRAGIGILHDYAAHRDKQLEMVLPDRYSSAAIG
jgi:DNA-binding transcriptional LysR family regulator